MDLKVEAERSIAFGRVEHAFELYKRVLEMEIKNLRTGVLKDSTSVERTMERGEFLKRKIAARPKGVAGALDLLTTALIHIMGAVMKKKGVFEEWTRSMKSKDLSSYLSLLISKWNVLPWNDKSNRSSGYIRTLCFEVKHWRNMWAHQKIHGAEDSYRAIDSVERLLRGLGTKIALASSYADDCKIFFKPAALRALHAS
jgi:hypothetical protein